MNNSTLLPSKADIDAAQVAIAPHAILTPLVPLPDPATSDRELWLKLECLQPTGSFKIRGASAAVAANASKGGPLITISAGNMARAVAHLAAQVGRESIAFVPDHAPEAKLKPIMELGGSIRKVPFDEWWRLAKSGEVPVPGGLFIHPFADRHVMAGNATIGRELAEQGDFDVVLVPWGGGGLSIGIAYALRAANPRTKVIAVEASTASPLRASINAGTPVQVAYTATFIDGIGSPEVTPSMWPLVDGLIADSLAVTPEAAKDAVRLVANRCHVIVEGAAACAIAAARDPQFAGKKVAIIASGGNIDLAKVAHFLE